MTLICFNITCSRVIYTNARYLFTVLHTHGGLTDELKLDDTFIEARIKCRINVRVYKLID